MAHRVKSGVAGLWQKLKPAEKKPEILLGKKDVLETLPEQLKRSIVPAPDWHSAALVLDKALSNGSNGGIQEYIAVVTPPHGDGGAILKRFSEIRGWRVIAPPTAEQILAHDDSWLKPLANNASPWVIPNLEKFYIRHYRGLALVRSFFTLLQQGRFPQGVIGCGSWAWAYFQQVMPELLPAPITLQAFDDVRLNQWLRGLAPNYQGKLVCFRQSDNGDMVLSQPSPTGSSVETTAITSQFIKYLAAYSRGNPGIAWTIWRSALYRFPGDAAATEQARAAGPDYYKTIWVPPWEQLNLRIHPASVSAKQLLVLHNLLLHDGMADARLPDVLPFTANECGLALSALKNIGLIEYKEIEWRLSGLFYPAVRQLLKDQGYLTDGF